MENKEEREPDSFLTGMTALLPRVLKRYLVGFSDGVLIVETWGSSPGEGPSGLEFTSLGVCLAWASTLGNSCSARIQENPD